MFTSSNFNLYLEDFEWLKFKKFTYKSGSFTLHSPPPEKKNQMNTLGFTGHIIFCCIRYFSFLSLCFNNPLKM